MTEPSPNETCEGCGTNYYWGSPEDAICPECGDSAECPVCGYSLIMCMGNCVVANQRGELDE